MTSARESILCCCLGFACSDLETPNSFRKGVLTALSRKDTERDTWQVTDAVL